MIKNVKHKPYYDVNKGSAVGSKIIDEVDVFVGSPAVEHDAWSDVFSQLELSGLDSVKIEGAAERSLND